jgi:hypothetical protein
MRDLDPSQYGEDDRREVNPRFKSNQQRGHRAARSIGGLKNARNGGVGYAVPTAGNGGSELLIFVRRAAHSIDLCSAVANTRIRVGNAISR